MSQTRCSETRSRRSPRNSCEHNCAACCKQCRCSKCFSELGAKHASRRRSRLCFRTHTVYLSQGHPHRPPWHVTCSCSSMPVWSFSTWRAFTTTRGGHTRHVASSRLLTSGNLSSGVSNLYPFLGFCISLLHNPKG